MGMYGGFFKGDKKKQKKDKLAREALKIGKVHQVPTVEIIGKSKKGR